MENKIRRTKRLMKVQAVIKEREKAQFALLQKRLHALKEEREAFFALLQRQDSLRYIEPRLIFDRLRQNQIDSAELEKQLAAATENLVKSSRRYERLQEIYQEARLERDLKEADEAIEDYIDAKAGRSISLF